MKGLGKELGDSLTLGFELVLPTLLCALIGWELDSRFGSAPFGLISGVFLGAVAGFWSVVRKFLK
ncbi:MAG: AtpZ/AtpI family protein [bacterium]